MRYKVEKVVSVNDRQITYRATAPTADEALAMLARACGEAVIEPQPGLDPAEAEALTRAWRGVAFGSVDADRPFVRGVT